MSVVSVSLVQLVSVIELGRAGEFVATATVAVSACTVHALADAMAIVAVLQSPQLREASPELHIALPCDAAPVSGGQSSRKIHLHESSSQIMRPANLAAHSIFLPDEPPPRHRPRSAIDCMLGEPILMSNSLKSAGRFLMTDPPVSGPCVESGSEEPDLHCALQRCSGSRVSRLSFLALRCPWAVWSRCTRGPAPNMIELLLLRVQVTAAEQRCV